MGGKHPCETIFLYRGCVEIQMITFVAIVFCFFMLLASCQQKSQSSRRKTKQFFSYFRFPTSHTTVHAVPHTAVPILGTIRGMNPSMQHSLPCSTFHWLSHDIVCNYQLCANNPDDYCPTCKLGIYLYHTLSSWQFSFSPSSTTSIYTYVAVVLATRQFP